MNEDMHEKGNWDLTQRKLKNWKKGKLVVDRSVRGSLVVDVDGNRDPFGTRLESVEGGLLVSDDEGNVRGSV